MASSFELQLQAFAEKAGARARQVTTKLCLDLASRTILRTPVGNASLWKNSAPKGYVGGRLRGNWNVGLGRVNRRERGPDKSGDAAIARAKSALHGRGKGDIEVYITNSLVYAGPVEYGHSTQAPAGMLRVTVSEFQTLVSAAVKEVNP